MKNKTSTGGKWTVKIFISFNGTSQSDFSSISAHHLQTTTCSFTLNGSFPMLLRHCQAAKALAMADRTSASRVG